LKHKPVCRLAPKTKVAPSRGRGLKLEVEDDRVRPVSRPFAGAWIETPVTWVGIAMIVLSPLRGGVD